MRCLSPEELCLNCRTINIGGTSIGSAMIQYNYARDNASGRSDFYSGMEIALKMYGGCLKCISKIQGNV
jgi:hypothetical protein